MVFAQSVHTHFHDDVGRIGEMCGVARYSEALALSDSNTHNLCTGCQLLNSGWRLQIKSINKAPCSSIKLMSLQKEGKGRETDALVYSSAS